MPVRTSRTAAFAKAATHYANGTDDDTHEQLEVCGTGCTEFLSDVPH